MTMSADELNNQLPPDHDDELAEELEEEREQRSLEMPAVDAPYEPNAAALTTDPSGAENAALADLIQRNVEIGDTVETHQIEDMPKALGKQTIEMTSDSATTPGMRINIHTDENGQPVVDSIEMPTQPSPPEGFADAAEHAQPASDAATPPDSPSEPVAPATPPAPAAAPRIVSEAPFGGVPTTSSTPTAPPPPNAAAAQDQPDSPAAEDSDPAILTPDGPTDRSSQTYVDEKDKVEPLVGSEQLPTEPAPMPPPDGIAEAADDDTRPSTPTEPVEPVPAATPPVAAASAPDVVTDAEIWDDSISPELAAVLFKSGEPVQVSEPTATMPAAQAAPTEGESAAAPAAAAPAAEPTPAPLPAAPPPAAPIQLTDPAQARTLPITAEAHSSPAPDAPLEAKTRYVRIEEPLKDDQGQRIEESWTYFKGDYPGLEGRLVRKVIIEENQYTDGSWHWTYERQYEGGGRDRRDVRANADRTYIEREDDVSALDHATGKKLSFKEEAALILAAPEREEKRGGLLSGLFGRDKDEGDAHDEAKIWRPATSSETRQARKEGGDAFDRGLLSAIFS